MTYLLSFTAASLFIQETKVVAELYLRYKNWDEVKKEVLENNLLQKNSQATANREFVELRKRISSLTQRELELFDEEDSRYLAYLACIKTYRFIYEFATEVLREKMLLFDTQLLPSDFISFFESKQASAKELESISETTQKKIRQVMFKIFEQAGLIDSTKSQNILKPDITVSIVRAIIEDDPALLRAFLYSDADIDYFLGSL